MRTDSVGVMAVVCVLACMWGTPVRGQEEGFTPLFNGSDFTGWEGNLDMFRIEDETIVAGHLDGPIPQNEFLATTREYENFELRFDAKLVARTYGGEYTNRGNAGIQIRSLRIPNHNEVGGYQVDMGIEPTRNIWGSLYDESRRRYMLQLVDQELVAGLYKDEDWNEFVILCEGPRIQVWLNGKQTVDFTEADPSIPRSGIIAPQIHSGIPSEAHYRNIRIKELPPSAKAVVAKEMQASSVERPRDPFVFRINLDDRPRMLVFGLYEGLWVAYDTERGGLHRVWDAGVRFRGPVYDTVHNVQPHSLGGPYILNALEESPWRVRRGESETMVKAEYLGYTLKDNVGTARFSLPLEDGTLVLIEETPEYYTNDEGMLGLIRTIRTSNVPEGAQVVLTCHFDQVSINPSPSSSGPFAIRDGERVKGSVYRIDGDLYLNSNAATWILSYFNPEVLRGEEKPAEEGAGDVEASGMASLDPIERGKMLLGENDCAACHTMLMKQIGPAFVDVALKYDDSEETRNEIAAKIRSGGQGVWGQRPMAAHPFLELADARDLAAYILSLDSGDQAEPKPGVAVDYYQTGVHLARLPQVAPGQYPNLSKAYPVLDFYSGNPDRGEDTDAVFENFATDFVMHASGFLNIAEKKEYEFRFTANNGGSLTIDREEFANGHYYEGTYRKTFKVVLEEGAHPFFIEFYHHLFDKTLRLEWRWEGQRKWELVPESVLTHSPYAIKPASPGLKELVKTTSPGFGTYLEDPHPSYTVTAVRPKGFEPRVGDLDVKDDGRIILSTWDGEVYLLENAMLGDSEPRKLTKIADGLSEPLGIVEVDGEIYVLQRWELTHLVDNDGDGITDEYRVLADDWGASADFHEWSFGLEHRQGFLYATLGIAQGKFARVQSPDRGSVIKVALDGSYSFLASGLREANGIGFGPDGALFTTDNEGEWLPANKFIHIPEDDVRFFGFRGEWHGDLLSRVKDTPPTLWLPLTEIANSPTQPVTLHHGPYEGQMIFGDVTHGGLKRVFLEKVGGEYQGAVFRFAQGLEVGIMRGRWGPDGSLYVAGLGSVQDFSHQGHQFGLERLTYNGKATFEMLAVRAKANGMEIEFTQPLRIGDGEMPEDYLAQQWWYQPTAGYGGPKKDLENLTIDSVTLSPDRRKVFLEIDGMKPLHVVYLNLASAMLSKGGLQLWTNETWYTLNAVPEERGKVAPVSRIRKDNALAPEIEAAGWRLLFDGESTAGWRGYRDAGAPANWSVRDGLLHGKGVDDGKQDEEGEGEAEGDDGASALMTAEVFDNFELEFDWNVESGADSGVFYHVDASGDTVGQTGLEMQIVDDRKHPDAQGVMVHASGAAYDVIPPRYGLAKGSGEFNHGRIVFDSGLVEHWVNGIRVVNFDLLGGLWKSKVNGSIFANVAAFAQAGKGHIVLQCRDAGVSFRNIRIRPLAARERAVAANRPAPVPTAPEERVLAPVAEIRSILLDEDAAFRDQDQAVRDLAHTPEGLRALIALAEENEFPDEMEEMAGVAVAVYGEDALRAEGLNHFPTPLTKDAAPVPPLSDLLSRSGNVELGEESFVTNCKQCHVVDGQGTDFGPDQSDVGTRLSKRGLYEAILDPSAVIAPEYIPYLFKLKDGRTLTGFILEEAEGKVLLRIKDGIMEEFDVRDVAERREQSLSAMPSDVHQMMTIDGLVDLVEYLRTLREDG